MRNYFKTKIVLPIAVSVAIALSILGSVLYFVKSVRADEIVTNQPALVVRKVNTYVNTPDYYIDGSLQTQEYKHNTIPLPYDTFVDVIEYSDIAIGGNDSYKVVSGDTVMLNNANLENSPDPEYKYIKENILVAFNCNEILSGPNPNFNFQTLQINVTLNGSAIHTGEEIIGSDSINRYFYMFLDLTNLQYDNNTPVPLSKIEGLYTFTFTYNRIDANNQTLPQEKTPISFYLINESTYVNNVEETDSNDRDNVAESVTYKYSETDEYFTRNQAEGTFGFRLNALGEYKPVFDSLEPTLVIGYKLLDLEGEDIEYSGDRYQRFINYQNQYNNLPERVLTVNTVEPRFSNTERIDRKSYGSGTQTVEKNYFNYNNISTSDYSGFVSGQFEEMLSLPSFIYDASKYNVSYTKLLYGTETKVTSSFEIKNESGALNGYLTFRYETNGVVTLGAPIKISVNDDGNYIYEIKFGDIGEYTLNVNYLVRLSENEFVIANQGAINTLLHTDKWNIVGTTKLYNFGYQLYHSNYSGIGNSELEFKNENESLYSDVTFKNSGVTAIQNNNVYSFSNNNYYLNTPVDICSTNQAPVSFKYFANMIQNGVNIVGFYRRYNNYDQYLAYKSEENSEELSKTNSLNNNTRFTSNGFYEVFLMYDFQYYERLNDDGVVKTLSSKIPHVQYFAFQISNREPTVTAKVLDENNNPTGTIVYANGWTNQNVIVTWSPNTVFDVMPRITIEKAVLGNGTSYTTLNPSQYALNGNQLTLIRSGSINTNGHYKLTINYGPGNSTRVIYRFTIDYEDITGIKQYALLGEQSTSEENKTTYILKDSTNEQILNSAFLFDWSNKRSGAVITANYAYIPLSSGGEIGLNDSYELNDVAGVSTDDIINSINEFDQILMKNGNQLITINEDIPYSKITDSITNTSGLYFTYNMKNSDVNSIRTAAGIYLFKFSDQAGNVAYRSVFVDNSKGVALKRTEGEEQFSLTEYNNVASRNTLLLWGTHKAIEVSGDALDFMENAKDSSDNYLYPKIVELLKEDYEGDTYLAIEIDNVTFEIDNSNNNDSQKVVTAQKYKLLKIKTDSTESSQDNWFNGENIFDIRIYDKSYVIRPTDYTGGIKENGELYYKTYKGFRLEMNPDNSLLMAWVYGSYYKDSNGTENAHKRLYSDSNTNRQQLFIEWKTNEGVYDIESIKYDFFPLIFDTTQENFPYSDDASLSDVDIMNPHKASTVNSGKVITTLPINTEFSTYYNRDITIAGKYVVTRTYVNDLDDTDPSGDTKEREYTFYVDRNGIVGYSQSGVLLGQLLSIIMGEGDSGTNFTGAQFLEDSSTNKLTTNKLPVKLYIPLQKFEFQDQDLYLSPEQANTLLNVFGLEYKLKKGDNVMTVPGLIFVNSAVYTITLSDKSGYYLNDDEKNKDPVEYIFSFTIENTLPNGDFVKYYGSDYLILTDDMPSLNSTNVKFVWKEPASPYMARIDEKNLTITSYTPTDTAGTVVFKVENGNVNVNNPHDLSIVPITGGQWDWEINLSNLPQDLSARYEIKIQYEGNKAYYNDYGETTFSIEEKIWFDFLPPEYNYTKLIEQDNFLSTLYNKASTTETKNFIGNFSNAQNNINFENYAFTIDSNYKFTDATTTGNSFWENRHDTYKIYYRQYDKYDETGAGINKQSLIPEDDRYSNLNIDPTRLRFDPDLKINKGGSVVNAYTNFVYSSDSSFYQQLLSSLGTDCLNKYYEIIEMDAAGNHRIYTVFLKSEDDLLKLDYYSSSEVTTGQTPITIDFLLDYDIIEGTTQIIKRVNATLFDLQDIRYDYMDDLQNGQNATPWINVSVKNNDTGIVNNYILSPIANASFVSLETLMENINTICTPYDFIKGNSWTITFKTELQESYVVEFRSPGKRLEPRIVDYSQSFVISFPYFESQSDVSDSTYLTEFRAYAAINGIIDFTDQQYLLETDSLSRTIVENLDKNSVYTYTFTLSGSNGGDYWFEFVDNFGRLYRRNKIVGITDVLQADLLSSEMLNGINYTSSQATIRYQSKLYNMVVEKKIGNDPYQPFNKDNFTMNVASNGVASFPLFSSADMASTNTSVVMYRLTFTNSSEQVFVWEIAYYSQLAEVTFSNSSSVIENINNSVSDRQIFISFNSNEKLFTTFVTGVLVYKNSNGNSIQENLGQISSGQSFSKIGKYTLSIYNLLGTRTTITFDVKEKVSSYYSVVNIINGVKANYILPSEVAYQNNSDIKHYFTIYEYEIEVDAAKQLKIENVGDPITNTQSGVEVAKTFVYRIYNTNGDINKMIAVTKIKATSNFVRTYGNNLEVNSVIQSGNSIKVAQTGDGIKTATVSVTNGFYLYEGNSIFIDCYYNQQYVGRLTTSELPLKFGMLLSDSGVYDFYFSDLAGNKQVFGNNGYFRIILLNDILFTVNGKQAVDNSVFNGTVIIALQQTGEYTLNTWEFYKNGVRLSNINKVNNTFTFRDYGIYNIKMTGNNGSLVTYFNFRIVNPNEAMPIFEYIGLNNYEIVKVVKDGDDITNTLKQRLDVSNIGALAISAFENGVGGAGAYQITVMARYVTRKPDQTFTFNVWINNDTTMIIMSNINPGDSSTSAIKLTLNKRQIYEKVGECVIMFNDVEWLRINASTATENKTEVYTVTENGTYNIKLQTLSGNTLLSFVITKKAPLNAIAIIVIILSVLAVSSIVFIFIKMRKGMRIK